MKFFLIINSQLPLKNLNLKTFKIVSSFAVLVIHYVKTIEIVSNQQSVKVIKVETSEYFVFHFTKVQCLKLTQVFRHPFSSRPNIILFIYMYTHSYFGLYYNLPNSSFPVPVDH